MIEIERLANPNAASSTRETTAYVIDLAANAGFVVDASNQVPGGNDSAGDPPENSPSTTGNSVTGTSSAPSGTFVDSTAASSDAWLSGNWRVEFADGFNSANGELPDASKWNFIELNPHRPSDVCDPRIEAAAEGACRPNNFVMHESVTDRNHAKIMNNALMMDVSANVGEAQVHSSFLRSYRDFGSNWETQLEDPGANHLFGPEEGPIYIEAAVNFSQAVPGVGAWWAFWLFAPDTWNEAEARTWFPNAASGRYQEYANNYDPYDENADTGMEVDILEFVPDASDSNFNIALFRSGQSALRPPISPPSNFTAFDADAYLAAVNPAYRDAVAANPNLKVDFSRNKFHTIGMYWDKGRYAFYLNGFRVWMTTERQWITQKRRNGIVLSWEHSQGTFGYPPRPAPI